MTDYSPRGEGTGASGWHRIGLYDQVERRALWARVSDFEGPLQRDEYGEIEIGVESLELCAGREGDDAYLKVRCDNPIFPDLYDCISRAIGAATDTPWFAGFIPVPSNSGANLQSIQNVLSEVKE